MDDEYKFSVEEIENLQEQNKQKIESLKNNSVKVKRATFTSVSKKLNGILDDEFIKEDKEKVEEVVDKDDVSEEVNLDIQDTNSNDLGNEEDLEEKTKSDTKDESDIEEIDESNDESSYVNLSSKNQDIIMKSWEKIDLQQIDKDIIEGKDLLNHNYNITYGENAAKFVHDIRKRYEVVICYLIGFNNEKRGIDNKTIFSNKLDDEWKYLSNYIKLLEKIRSFRK